MANLLSVSCFQIRFLRKRMLKRRFIVTLFVLSLVPVSATMAEETKFDLVLRGGRVVDGTGAP